MGTYLYPRYAWCPHHTIISTQPHRAEMHTHVYKYEHLPLIKVLDWFGPTARTMLFAHGARKWQVHTRVTTLTRPSSRGHSRLIPALFSRGSLATGCDTSRICLIKGTKLRKEPRREMWPLRGDASRRLTPFPARDLFYETFY